MSDDFRGSAARLAGLIPATLGWTPDQFWNATPAELSATFGAFSAASPDYPNIEPLDKTQLEKLKETLDHG